MANDSLLYIIITIFIVIGVMLPYVNDATNQDTVNNDYDSINEGFKTQSSNPITIITILISVIKMFTFTFGNLPLWLDLILFMPMRIIAWIMIIEKIPFT